MQKDAVNSQIRISVNDLQAGMFITLEAGWMNHPFLFNSFKIKDQAQIETLKDLKITEVIYDPGKSDPMTEDGGVSSQTGSPKSPQEQKPEKQATTRELWQLKQARIKLLRAQREQINRCQQRFDRTTDKIRKIMFNLKKANQNSLEEADLLVKDVVKALFSQKDVMLYLMNTSTEVDGMYYHSLNVAVLALMLGKECGLDELSLRTQGIGALFHDIGKERIPKSILHKKSPLKSAELKFLQQHPNYGLEMVSQINNFPDEAAKTIRDHHETIDGKGYPSRIQGNQISILTQCVIVANIYDNLCNKMDPKDSLTPFEAIAYIFSRKKGKIDQNLLSIFVRRMGVYPPGTIVQLSDGAVGIVLSTNSENSLRPGILIYDPDIPRNEALIIDMIEAPDLKIEKSISPKNLPPEIYEYLGPRERISYYLSREGKGS